MTSEPKTSEPKITLRNAIQSIAPAAAPSDALKQRIASLAADAAARVPRNASRRRQTRLHLLGAGATALLMLLFLLIPRPHTVNAYQHMLDSVRDVRSMHSITWYIRPDGTRFNGYEVWYEAENWRIDNNSDPKYRSIQIRRSGRTWNYDTATNTVTQDDIGATPEWHAGIERDNDIGGFSLGALLSQELRSGEKPHVTLLGPATDSVRPAHLVMLTSAVAGFPINPQQPLWRSLITVDDATGLAVRQEQQTRKPAETQWVTNAVVESQYNQTLPASVFAPDAPNTARYLNAVTEREYWRKRLNTGVATQQIILPDNRGCHLDVVIRDFQVNQKGDVFLLFTANNEIGRDIPFGTAELTDEFGTRYVDPSSQNSGVGAQTFLPNCIDRTVSGEEKMSGFAFGDRQLEGIRWVPLKLQTPWTPRRFRLTLHLTNIGAVVFNLPVHKAEAKVVPDYMPFAGRPLSPDAGVQTEEEIQARAWAFYHDEHDLPQALAAYQALIACRTGQQKSNNSTVANSDQWLEVYHILSEMGHTDQAKAALLRAKKDNDTQSLDVRTHDRIQSEMRKLGLAP